MLMRATPHQHQHQHHHHQNNGISSSSSRCFFFLAAKRKRKKQKGNTKILFVCGCGCNCGCSIGTRKSTSDDVSFRLTMANDKMSGERIMRKRRRRNLQSYPKAKECKQKVQYSGARERKRTGSERQCQILNESLLMIDVLR